MQQRFGFKANPFKIPNRPRDAAIKLTHVPREALSQTHMKDECCLEAGCLGCEDRGLNRDIRNTGRVQRYILNAIPELNLRGAMGLEMTLGDAAAAGMTVAASCENGHDYIITPASAIDLVGRYAKLDEFLFTRSWCPDCGKLANSFMLRWARDAT